MKNIYNSILLLLMSYAAMAQWQSISSYGGGSAYSVAAFTIGNKAYLGGGNPSLNSFFEFDKATGNWTSLGSIPGGVNRASAIRFAINGKGYVGCGSDLGQPSTQTFYEYDPVADSWTQKSDFGGGDRHSGFYASANGKGYAICGSGSSGTVDEVWEYDPSNDKWTQRASYPGGALYWPAGFVINDKIYVCTGNSSGTDNMELHMYDPLTDTWTQKANFIGTGRSSAVGFAVGNKGYIVGGLDGSFANITTCYSYDPAADSWQAEPNLDYPTGATAWCSAFVIGGDAYVGTGATVTTGVSSTSAFHTASIGSSIGLDDAQNGSGWTVYPNPTTGILYLENGVNDHSILEVEVRDMNGRTVTSKTVDQFRRSVNLGHLAKGSYILHMKKEDAEMLNQKIVIH